MLKHKKLHCLLQPYPEDKLDLMVEYFFGLLWSKWLTRISLTSRLSVTPFHAAVLIQGQDEPRWHPGQFHMLWAVQLTGDQRILGGRVLKLQLQFGQKSLTSGP